MWGCGHRGNDVMDACMYVGALSDGQTLWHKMGMHTVMLLVLPQ